MGNLKFLRLLHRSFYKIILLFYMSVFPEQLMYTVDHEWVLFEKDNTALIGITEHAQESLGDITFIELPVVGDSFQKGDPFGVVESVKAASDLYLPVDGEVSAINEELESAPELVNRDPYKSGWIIKILVHDPEQTDGLMNASDYATHVG